MEKPLISFIMPVYNDGSSVTKAIDSIFDQDWPNIEVIAVNDGSKDNTRAVLDRLKKKHKKLTVIHFDTNRGACVARNEGAKVAKFHGGNYYAWLPADAYLYPGMVRVWLETLEKYPEYDFIYGGYNFVDDEGNKRMFYPSEKFDPYLLTVANFIDGSFPIRATSYWAAAEKMGQKDGLWDPAIKSLQDWDFWLSVVHDYKGKGIYYQDAFFETTLPHPGGLSDDSHRNWLARTNTIKQKHKIPKRKICVTGPGARFFAKYLAQILDADFKDMPPQKPHDYEMIYEIGFYPSIAEQCGKVFVEPTAFPQYESFIKAGKGAPYTAAVKVVHLVGTDLLQLRDDLSKNEQAMYRQVLNNIMDHLLVEFEPTLKEAKELGLNASILPIPPRTYFDVTPLPKQFTVAVYAPEINQSLYNYEMMLEVAKGMPNVEFKFFGNPKARGIDPKYPNVQNVGYVLDMKEFIKDCSCLLRITEHDGLPQSVLEFLSAGRRVIFNQEFKYVCTPKKTVKDVKAAVKEEMAKGLNNEAAKWIRKEFDKEKFKKAIYALLKYDPKKYWNKKAERWSNKGVEYYNTDDWKDIEPYYKKINPKSVIDIGCGEGQWNEKFEAKYLGVDISSEMIKYAKKKYPKRAFSVSALEELVDYKGPIFDMAFCYTVFEHIPEENMATAVAALKKVAKRAIIIEPSNVITKHYCHAHDYSKWFKIKEKKELNTRTLMIVDL